MTATLSTLSSAEIYTPLPGISNVSPTSGPVGATVTITGTNFGPTQGSSTVTFNGIAAVPTLWNASGIVVLVPNGATSGPIVITANGFQASVNFQVLNLYLTSISPSIAGIGSTVTLVGAGFGASQGTGSLSIGGLQPFVFTWSDTQIVAVVPPTTTSGLVQVSQGGQTSNSLNFIVAAPNVTGISPVNGAPGTQVTFFGSGFGASQGTGNVLLGTNLGAIISWSDTQIVATVTSGSSSGRAQVLQGGIASNFVAFTVSGSAPAISTVSPSTGAAGVQVTATGSGFGASQGNGKVLLGTAYGAVVSWSDTQVVATVALGSSSGSVQIVEGAVSSNALAFNVITPTITSISPAIGAAGTQVTITGSGFGPAQGSGNAWLGSTYASVVSWSDAQVIATVAPGSASGYAQILQNGVWSNSVPFNSSTPHIASVTPASGASGTQITITGSGFGSSTGTLQLGTMQGSVSSWSDSQIVASVASGSLTGIVQAQQNGTTSNSLRFVVPTSGTGNSDTLVPSLLNLLVGQTRTIQALSPTGTPVTGLTWTSSDSTVVSLSTDDPPILTAVAPGHITITAGDSSSDVTVSSGFALPVGTIIWSAPGDGSGVTSIIPAVPSPSGVADTFAVQASGNVQAITGDGLVAWTANVGTGYTSLNADFQGGLVAASPYTVTKYDGITGQQASQYTYSNPGFSNRVYFGTDGTIFTIDGGSVVGIDPATGTTKFSVAMRQGSYSSIHTCEYQSTSNGNSLPFVGASALAGDGYLYVSYEYVNSSDQDAVPSCTGSAGYSTTTGVVLRVGPAGDSTSVILGSFTTSGQTTYVSENQTPFIDYFIQTNSQSGYLPQITAMITNADQGIFATWSLAGTSAYCSEEIHYITPPDGGSSTMGCVPAMPGQSGVMILGNAGITSQTTSADNYGPVLQDVNGIFYGSTNEGSLSAFDQSGTVKWSVPGYSPVVLTIDGSIIAQSQAGTYASFDQNGVANGQIASFPTLSWKGAYQLGSEDSVVPSPLTIMPSFAAVFAGNLTSNGSPVVHNTIGVYWCGQRFSGTCAGLSDANGIPLIDLGFYYGPALLVPSLNGLWQPPPSVFDFTAHLDWDGVILAQAFSALKKAYAPFPALVVELATPPIQPGFFQGLFSESPPAGALQEEHIVRISGNLFLNMAGLTFDGISPSSVYYGTLLNGVQIDLNLVNQLPTTDPSQGMTPTQSSAFQSMLVGLGMGIGNSAAHEIGHQFSLPYMDCDKPADPTTTPPTPAARTCPGTAPHNTLYEYYDSSVPQFSFIGPPLQWNIADAIILALKLLKK
jgi:hypothetical protein